MERFSPEEVGRRSDAGWKCAPSLAAAIWSDISSHAAS